MLAERVLVEAAPDVLVAEDLLGGLEQADRLAVPDPVADFLEEVGGVVDAGARDDLVDRLLTVRAPRPAVVATVSANTTSSALNSRRTIASRPSVQTT